MALALWFTHHSGNEYRLSVAGVLLIELGLKIQVSILHWFAVVSNCRDARVENDTRSSRHEQHTHGHHICCSHLQHTSDYRGYVRYLGHTARSSHKSDNWSAFGGCFSGMCGGWLWLPAVYGAQQDFNSQRKSAWVPSSVLRLPECKLSLRVRMKWKGII